MQEIPIVLIGHKDHGKSTLVGRMLLDTKSVKESRVKEIQEVDKAGGREFELAHLIDAFKEEREREMTMDTAMARIETKKRAFQLIDVPGHGELISHMLTGASGAKAAILLVSIEEGICEQTLQHLELAKLLGIEQLIVACNKIDKLGYQKDQFNNLVLKLKEILEKIGYPLEKINFFPISAKEGDNVVFKSSKTPWHEGCSLIDFIEDNIEVSDARDNDLRLLVQDRYDDVLVGKVETGKISNGQEVLFLPENKRVKIDLVGDSKIASAGENIGFRIKEGESLERGTVGILPGSKLKVSNVLEGQVFWIKEPSQNSLVCECGTAQSEGELLKKEKSNYKILLKKDIAFDPSRKSILGKIVFKDKGKIIAVGNIEK